MISKEMLICVAVAVLIFQVAVSDAKSSSDSEDDGTKCNDSACQGLIKTPCDAHNKPLRECRRSGCLAAGSNPCSKHGRRLRQQDVKPTYSGPSHRGAGHSYVTGKNG